DWSSDVCSSDLVKCPPRMVAGKKRSEEATDSPGASRPPGSRLDDLFSTILVLQSQGADRTVGPQLHVCFFCARRSDEGQSCALLGGADFDRWTATLSDQPEQHRFTGTLAIL